MTEVRGAPDEHEERPLEDERESRELENSDVAVLKFSCEESSSTLGRGGLYELVQYFKNKLK